MPTGIMMKQIEDIIIPKGIILGLGDNSNPCIISRNKIHITYKCRNIGNLNMYKPNVTITNITVIIFRVFISFCFYGCLGLYNILDNIIDGFLLPV